MPKDRVDIPKAVREKVLGEYDHQCALCDAVKPQLHHIDEDPSNNDPLNLIPLCPNHHLNEQHNPHKTIDPLKLKLFRIYKHPYILKPQFNSLFNRLRFLFEIDGESDGFELEASVRELVQLIIPHEMGDFYARQINQLFGGLDIQGVHIGDSPEAQERWDTERERASVEYRQRLVDSRDRAFELIGELLWYQNWPEV